MKELSNELGYTINKIKEILINNNIRIRQGRQRKTFLEEDINKIKEMAQ